MCFPRLWRGLGSVILAGPNDRPPLHTREGKRSHPDLPGTLPAIPEKLRGSNTRSPHGSRDASPPPEARLDARTSELEPTPDNNKVRARRNPRNPYRNTRHAGDVKKTTDGQTPPRRRTIPTPPPPRAPLLPPDTPSSTHLEPSPPYDNPHRGGG